MDAGVDSTERTTAAFVLFAVGFLGFLIALSGVILASAGAAICGTVILLLTVAWFARRDD